MCLPRGAPPTALWCPSLAANTTSTPVRIASGRSPTRITAPQVWSRVANASELVALAARASTHVANISMLARAAPARMPRTRGTEERRRPRERQSHVRACARRRPVRGAAARGRCSSRPAVALPYRWRPPEPRSLRGPLASSLLGERLVHPSSSSIAPRGADACSVRGAPLLPTQSSAVICQRTKCRGLHRRASAAV